MLRVANRRLCAAALLIACSAQCLAQTGPLRFRITLVREIAKNTTSGRLLVFMSGSERKPLSLGVGFVPGQTWVAGAEIESISPGQTIDFDPNEKAYPKPFSQAKPGTYHFMAVLDVDHSYAYNGPGGGDLNSVVETIENLNPASTKPVELTLTKATPPRPALIDTENVKHVEFTSPKLSSFWGRPIKMRARVVIPPSYVKHPNPKFPTVYHVHGYGGTHVTNGGGRLVTLMEQGKMAEMVHVYLDASFPTGHHVFADSVNNGPWGAALTQDLIPFLESRFRLVAAPYARYLTGHSSGGWSTLWLQVAYPDFFGGTWSTSPDPVDFRSFTGIDASPGSTDNAYRKKNGKAKNLVRAQGRELVSIEEFVRQEEVAGEYGGQFASFEWVFSPRGQDGRPMKLFNRVTGGLDPAVEIAWKKYDIRRVLDENWATLGPRLKGKLHVICGEEDTFHLEEAVKYLAAFFQKVKADAVCELVPGRDHGNLFMPYQTFPEGLEARIDKEMWAAYKQHAPAKGK